VIAGIYRPDTGVARIHGKVSLLAGLGVGFNVHLSGRENAYLYGSILGHPRKVIDEAMDGIIEFSELHKFIDQPLRIYSSGMRARLGFSIASIVRPDILLIDEVLGVGDAEFRERSQRRIEEMVRDALTVVIVSHSLRQIEQICNRAVLVDGGGIKMIGDPSDVIAAYKGKAQPLRQTANLSR
jgi:ABC-type polysaccharide/polyol phosphate transport system ATPase subunit